MKSTDWRAVAGIVHVVDLDARPPHQIRSGPAGCWCEPMVYDILVERLGQFVKVAAHGNVTPKEAKKLLERS